MKDMGTLPHGLKYVLPENLPIQCLCGEIYTKLEDAEACLATHHEDMLNLIGLPLGSEYRVGQGAILFLIHIGQRNKAGNIIYYSLVLSGDTVRKNNHRQMAEWAADGKIVTINDSKSLVGCDPDLKNGLPAEIQILHRGGLIPAVFNGIHRTIGSLQEWLLVINDRTFRWISGDVLRKIINPAPFEFMIGDIAYGSSTSDRFCIADRLPNAFELDGGFRIYQVVRPPWKLKSVIAASELVADV